MREVGTSLVTIGVQSLDVVIRSEFVREVLGDRSWIQIPGARIEIPGVVIWGGQAVSVLDLARFHNGMQQLGPEEKRPRMVIVEASGITLGVPADRVSEVWKIHDDKLKPRQLHDFPLARSEVVHEDETVLPLLEPELLLARLDVEV